MARPNGGILNLGFAGIQSIAKIALGIFLTSTIVGTLGLAIAVPAISYSVLMFVAISYLAIFILDSLYGHRDPSLDLNYMVISIAPFFPNGFSEAGRIWLVVQLIAFSQRIFSNAKF